MDQRKLKQKRKTNPKPGVFRNCMKCILKNPEDEENEMNETSTLSLHSPKLTRHEMFATYSSASSLFGLVRPEPEMDCISPKNALLSRAYVEKIENPPIKNPVDPSTEIERIKNDQIVKTILGKYLAVKREEMLKEKPEVLNDKSENSTMCEPKKNDCFNVECLSSGSSETVLLDNSGVRKKTTKFKECPRRKIDFPAKCRSAPTNCTAHDSLADICNRMNSFKQEENKSENFVTCCSEENVGDNPLTKKKLELIFEHSSEEIPCFEDNPSIFLRYEISCEKSTAPIGTSRAESVLLQSTDECNSEYVRNTKPPSPELYLHSFGKGEIGEVRASNSSLKWKLIISHHGRGDFR